MNTLQPFDILNLYDFPFPSRIHLPFISSRVIQLFEEEKNPLIGNGIEKSEAKYTSTKTIFKIRFNFLLIFRLRNKRKPETRPQRFTKSDNYRDEKHF